MPQVRDRIVAEFGMEPEIYDPDEAVAKGAALFGLKESLQDEVKEILAPDRPGGRRPTGAGSTSPPSPRRRSPRRSTSSRSSSASP